jgi:hypothetical protein
MSARPAATLLAGTAVVLAAILVALALDQSASSAAGAPPGFPAAPEAAASATETTSTAPSVLPILSEDGTGSPSRPAASILPVARRSSHPARPTFQVAIVRKGLRLRSRPGDPADAHLGARTEFGSQRVLSVAARRGPWLGVVTSARPNGRLAWIRRNDPALRLSRTAWSLHADLSGRSIELRHFGRTVRTVHVAIGRPGSPTPTGRFAVTDKLDGGRFGPYYGCCILALSGYQVRPPAGWRGGNRIAIHGTDAPATIGGAASAGCLRAGDADLTVLMRRVPLGTPVFIRS